ncbi:MAG: right-handed parallel beta-helix repeat-containing protein [Myxococcota bacterium]
MILGLLLLASNIEVGPSRAITRPSQAAQMAHDGDVILIDAGLYSGDVTTWRANNLTIRGVGGRAHLDANGMNAGGKGIWVIQGSNTTVESIEFSGAAVPDMNGAGIRQEGPGLTVRDCYFHDNEDGILSGDAAQGDILIESSIFEHNGAGDGFSHNMYIGHVRTFTLRGSFSHDARVGHLVKSRALTNIIEGNRITEEDGSDASLEIDLPNGGVAIIVGNVIQQGANSQNSGIISFAAEGASNPNPSLFVAYNTVINALGRGNVVDNHSAVAAVVVDNIISGGGTVLNGPGTPSTNLVAANPGFVDLAHLDVHLAAGAMGIGGAVDPGMGGGRSLVPTIEYVHPAHSTSRASGHDQGAFEHDTVITDAGVVPAGDAAVRDTGIAGPDTGVAPVDTGVVFTDTGLPAFDTGTGPADTGAVTADAGASAADAGVGADAAAGDGGDGAVSGGCGCAATRTGISSLVAVAAVLLVALLRRRRGPQA